MPERWQRELVKLAEIEPPAGLWERATAIAAGGLSQARRRSPRRRLWPALGAAAAVATVAVAASLIGQLSWGQVTATPDRHGRVFADPQFGWTLRYPAGLRVRHFHAGFRFPLDGVRITSFAPDLGKPTGAEPEMSWLREFPADGVAAQIWYLGVFSPYTLMATDGLPLRAAAFHQERPYTGGSEPAPQYRVFTVDGFKFNAAVWIGKDASRAARHALWAAVQSLRFPALRSGTIWNSDVYVLRRASQYPAGSITFIPAAALPAGARLPHPHAFYLVHARHGFYVVFRRFSSYAGPRVSCLLSYDRAARQFYCPGTALRWDLAGLLATLMPGTDIGH